MSGPGKRSDGATGVQVGSGNFQVNYFYGHSAGADGSGELTTASGPAGSPRGGHAFISYVREDSGEVDVLQRTLEAAGVRVWRDTADLWPGEDWRAKIRDAITHDALVFIACFSSRSAGRGKSHQNEELTLAVEQLRLRRPDDPWLVPVRFDDCDVPNLELGAGRTLESVQRVDLFGPDRDRAAQRLVAAVQRLLRDASSRTAGSSEQPAKPEGMPGLHLPLAASSLPPPTVGFTGRQDELSALHASWAEKEALPVVWSIAGPAGIGKSALAINFAHQIAGEFPDGQLYIDLRGAGDGTSLDPLDVLRQFLKALGAPQDEIPPGVGERAGMFRSMLKNRRFLMVLDNAHDEVQVRLLLPSSPGCMVLITSRRPLGALDTVRPPLQLGVLDEQEAVEMLSRLVGPDRIRAEPEQAAEVVRLCGGLPLALRIVAGRLRTRPQWPISEILRRLADERRLVELRVGDLDIRASFALSYRELSDTQALMFRRLGILPGPTFDVLLATAIAGQTVIGGAASAITTVHSTEHANRYYAAVCQGTKAIQDEQRAAREEVDCVLEELVDAQLIEIAALGHYRMHDLVRLFASELLHEDGAHMAEEMMASFNYVFWAQAHAAAAVTWNQFSPDDLLTGFPGFRSHEEVRDWLERNRLNLVNAVNMAHDNNQDNAVVELSRYLDYLFQRYGFWADLEPVFNAARAATQRAGNLSSEAEYLFKLGGLRLRERSFPEAITAFKESLALLRSGEAKEQRAEVLTFLANALTCAGRLGDAEACLDEAEHLTQALTGAASPLSARIAGGRATLLDLRGDTSGAFSVFEQAVEISRDVGDILQQASFLERIGCIYLRRHQRVPAIRYLKESLALCQGDDMLHLRIRSESMLSLARAHMIDGISGEATELLSQALESFQRLQIPEKEAEVLYYQVLAYKRLQKQESAQDCWKKAIEALSRANPETTTHLRDLVEKSRPQQLTLRRTRTRQSSKSRSGRRRRGQSDANLCRYLACLV